MSGELRSSKMFAAFYEHSCVSLFDNKQQCVILNLNFIKSGSVYKESSAHFRQLKLGEECRTMRRTHLGNEKKFLRTPKIFSGK